MVKGSYTVELSLLSPLILGIVVLILYVSFYFYNAGIMQTAAFATALEAEKYRDCSKEKQKELLKGVGEKKLEGLLLGMGEITTNVNIQNEVYTVTYQGKLDLPFLNVLFLQENLSWNISVKGKSKVHHEKEWIQNVRRIWKLGEGLAGEE